MKLKRKGNPKGLDIDYEVTDVTPSEAKDYHESLLKKGYLFTYASNGKYEPPTKNVVLHYIDKSLKLYDFAFLFTKQEPRSRVIKESKSKLDEAYDRAKNDMEFKERLMTYMRYNKILNAFSKHISLYGALQGEYLVRLNKVLKELKDLPLPESVSEESLKKLDRDLFMLFLS